MNSYYIAIAKRADHRCEYCQAPEIVFNFPFEVEHIIPLSRQGKNNPDNLALSCSSCNLRKGSRIMGNFAKSDSEISFFHPRNEKWHEHFYVNTEIGMLEGITPTGEVTVKYLEMNSPAQLGARQLWIRIGISLNSTKPTYVSNKRDILASLETLQSFRARWEYAQEKLTHPQNFLHQRH